MNQLVLTAGNAADRISGKAAAAAALQRAFTNIHEIATGSQLRAAAAAAAAQAAASVADADAWQQDHQKQDQGQVTKAVANQTNASRGCNNSLQSFDKPAATLLNDRVQHQASVSQGSCSLLQTELVSPDSSIECLAVAAATQAVASQAVTDQAVAPLDQAVAPLGLAVAPVGQAVASPGQAVAAAGQAVAAALLRPDAHEVSTAAVGLPDSQSTALPISNKRKVCRPDSTSLSLFSRSGSAASAVRGRATTPAGVTQGSDVPPYDSALRCFTQQSPSQGKQDPARLQKFGLARGQRPSQATGQSPSQATGQSPSQATGQSPSWASGQSPSQEFGLARGQSPSQATRLSPGQATEPSPSLETGQSPAGQSWGHVRGQVSSQATGQSPSQGTGQSPAGQSPSQGAGQSPSWAAGQSPAEQSLGQMTGPSTNQATGLDNSLVNPSDVGSGRFRPELQGLFAQQANNSSSPALKQASVASWRFSDQPLSRRFTAGTRRLLAILHEHAFLSLVKFVVSGHLTSSVRACWPAAHMPCLAQCSAALLPTHTVQPSTLLSSTQTSCLMYTVQPCSTCEGTWTCGCT